MTRTYPVPPRPRSPFVGFSGTPERAAGSMAPMARKKDQLRRLRAEARKADQAVRRRASARQRAAAATLERELLRSSKRESFGDDDVAWAFGDPGHAALRAQGRLSTYAQALRERLTADPARRSSARYRPLLTWVIDTAPRLVDGHGALDRLWGVAMLPWVRTLETFKPKGKSASRCFRALVDHLVVEWPVRPFLYSAFEQTAASHRPYRQVRLFDLIAKGGSARNAIKQGLLPATLTKKMCHRFLQTTVGHDIPAAVRLAQATELGASKRLASALAGSRLGRDLDRDQEDFRFSVVQWFVNHPMLDPAQVGPLLDYIAWRKQDTDRRREEAAQAVAVGGRIDLPGVFSMKGRSAGALFRDMERWHGDLAREAELRRREQVGTWRRAPMASTFAPSGIRGFQWERKKGRRKEVWTAVELLTARALSDEGRALAHCVYSYGYSVAKGRTSIWSLRLDRERMLTVEIDNTNRRMVQARGLRNRMPTNAEQEALRRWAEQADLAVRV